MRAQINGNVYMYYEIKWFKQKVASYSPSGDDYEAIHLISFPLPGGPYVWPVLVRHYVPHHLRVAIPLPGNFIQGKSFYLVYASRGLDSRVSSLAPTLIERSIELLRGSLLPLLRKGMSLPSGVRRSIPVHG